MNRKDKFKTLLLYSGIFAVLALFVLYQYYANGRSLINYQGDGYRQDFRAIIYFKDYIKGVVTNLVDNHVLALPQYDLRIGEGGDIYQTLFHGMLNGPFVFLYLLVDNSKLYLMHDFIVFLRLFVTGLGFIYMMSVKGVDNPYALALSALTYVFSFVALASSLIKCYHFINPMIVLPLVIAGIDKVFKKEKPYVLILSVFLMVLYNFYFFYMIAISAAVYTIVKCLVEKRSPILIFIIAGYALIGMAMGAVSLFPALKMYIGNPRIAISRTIHLFFPSNYYQSVINTFVISDFSQSTTFGGFGLLNLFTLVLAFKKPYDKTFLILLATETICLIFPIFSIIFNGFSYPTDRWCFIIALLLSYQLGKKYEELVDLKKKDIGYLLLPIVILALLAINDNRLKIYLLMMALGLLLIALIIIFKDKRIKSVLISCIFTICALFSLLNFLSPNWWNYVSRGTRIADVIEYQSDEEMALEELGDDSFYRYSLDSYNNKSTNSSINSDYYSTQFYWSNANHLVTEFRDNLGLFEHNAFHYDNYNSRNLLMELAGVKYLLSRDDNTIVPYNYEYLKTVNDIDIYRCNSETSILHFYDECMSESDWLELDMLERQNALSEYAIVKDDEGVDYHPAGKSLDYEVVATSGLSIDGNSISVDEENAYLTIVLEDSEDEVHFLISGLVFEHDNPNWNKNLSASFSFETNGQKTSFNHKDVDHNRYSGKEDYLVYLGNGIKDVKVTFDTVGTYSFENISFQSSVSKTLGEKAIAASNLEIGNVISFDTKLEDKGMLVISIPYSEGFEAIVNGEKMELDQIDTMYMGLMLEAGDYHIQLVYQTPYLKYGLIVSVISITSLLVFMIVSSKREALRKQRDSID